MNIHRATLPLQYGPNFEGLEFSITGIIPPSDVPLGRMAQLCPFAREIVCVDDCVKPVTLQIEPALLGGPDLVARASQAERSGRSVTGVDGSSVQVGQLETTGPGSDNPIDVDATSVQTPEGTVCAALSDFMQSDQFISSGCLGAEDISAVNKCSRMHYVVSRERFLQNPFQLACIWLECQQRSLANAIRSSEQLRS